MVYSYANPDAPIPEQEIISFAVGQGYYTPYRWPFTSPGHMMEIALHYAPIIRTGTVTTQGEGLALLADQLREGEPVIIDVPLHLSDLNSVAHFIVVTGISREAENVVVIHYNDPFTGEQETTDWEGNEGVWNGWQNNNDPGGSGWWLAIPPP
jgi:hypothetical protein